MLWENSISAVLTGNREAALYRVRDTEAVSGINDMHNVLINLIAMSLILFNYCH